MGIQRTFLGLHRPLLAMLLLGAAACTQEPQVGGFGDVLLRWRLSAEPLAVVGLLDEPAHILDGVVGGLLLADGRMVIGDRGSGEIRVFSEEGSHQSTFGGRGGGPGEFRRLRAIVHGPEDGICAWDFMLSRLTCFAPSGALVSIAEPDLTDAQQAFPPFVGVFADGSFVLRDWVNTRNLKFESEGERRDSISYLHFDLAGRPVAVLARAAGEETYLFNRYGIWSDEEVLFGRKTVDHLDGNRLIVATNDSLELRVFASSGAIERAIRRRVALPPIDHTMVSEAKSELLREFEAMEIRSAKAGIRMDAEATERLARARREFIERRPYRSTRPAFAEVYLDHTGRTWLGARPLAGDSTRTWTILTPNFEPEATVDLPVGARILDIGADRILLQVRNELDVESVLLHRLERPT